jgi:hypothetical protein
MASLNGWPCSLLRFNATWSNLITSRSKRKQAFVDWFSGKERSGAFVNTPSGDTVFRVPIAASHVATYSPDRRATSGSYCPLPVGHSIPCNRYKDAGNVLTAAFKIFANVFGLPSRLVGPATDIAPRICPPLTTGTATQVNPSISSSASSA